MNTTEILVAAKALIQNAKHWTKATNARNKNGWICSPLSYLAVSWCAAGAVLKICGGDQHLAGNARIYLGSFARSVHCSNPSVLNDTRDHDLVMEMFDAAITASSK